MPERINQGVDILVIAQLRQACRHGIAPRATDVLHPDRSSLEVLKSTDVTRLTCPHENGEFTLLGWQGEVHQLCPLRVRRNLRDHVKAPGTRSLAPLFQTDFDETELESGKVCEIAQHLDSEAAEAAVIVDDGVVPEFGDTHSQNLRRAGRRCKIVPRKERVKTTVCFEARYRLVDRCQQLSAALMKNHMAAGLANRLSCKDNSPVEPGTTRQLVNTDFREQHGIHFSSEQGHQSGLK